MSNCVLLRLTHVCMNMYHLLPLIIVIQLFNVVTRRIKRECTINFWIWIWMWWVHVFYLIFTFYFNSIAYQQLLASWRYPIHSFIHSFLQSSLLWKLGKSPTKTRHMRKVKYYYRDMRLTQSLSQGEGMSLNVLACIVRCCRWVLWMTPIRAAIV